MKRMDLTFCHLIWYQVTYQGEHLEQMLIIPSGNGQKLAQGSILFNIYINDTFYFVNEDNVTNYAGDTTPYSVDTNVETLISNLLFCTSKSVWR